MPNPTVRASATALPKDKTADAVPPAPTELEILDDFAKVRNLFQGVSLAASGLPPDQDQDAMMALIDVVQDEFGKLEEKIWALHGRAGGANV